MLLHATTLVSNALIERKGARTALVSTKGFRDVLKIGREKKFDIYDLQIERPVAACAGALVIRGVRADRSGWERDSSRLSGSSVLAVADAIREGGADAVAVCLLHSYMNPAHEMQVRELLRERLGAIPVSLSSEVLPEMREYERASTTAANAFVQPVIADYLERVRRGPRRTGLVGVVLRHAVGRRHGGAGCGAASCRPHLRIGPAAGAVTAAHVAHQRKLDRVLSFDMGGTTAKTSADP